MAITREDIDKLAVLARLNFEDGEYSDITAKLGSIVAFVDQLQAADTNEVMPMAHPLDQVQRLRADEADPNIDRDQYQQNSSAVAEHLYLVPRVIE